MSQRIGFVTCVELGESCIEEVHALGGTFALFMTLRDERARNKSGRIYLDDLSESSQTPLVKLRHINDPEAVAAIRDAELDWLFIIGWSQIANEEVLAAPTKGVLGMHPTLLPVGRGRAAIPWAILKGLERTGVTLFKLDSGVDTGPVIDQLEIPLRPDETATSLYERVNDAHRELIRRTWPALQSETVHLKEQDESRATEWPERKPEDGQIWPSMTVDKVDRLVRAVTRPYPGAFVELNGKIYTVWAGRPAGEPVDEKQGFIVQCADGKYQVTDYEQRG